MDRSPSVQRIRRGQGWSAAGIALACALTGCSSLEPQVFSERLQVRRGADGQFAQVKTDKAMSLDEAYAEADFMRRRYLTAVVDQGNAGPQLSAGLLGLSALTLLQGLNGSNAQDIAGVGIVGATAWSLGNTLLSRPRLEVYRAGAEALTCAMAAVDPLHKGKARLGTLEDKPGPKTLYGAMADVELKTQALRRVLDIHAGAQEGSTVVVPAIRSTRNCRAVPAKPDPVPAGASPAERFAIEERNRAKPPQQVCRDEPGKSESTETKLAPAPVRAAFRVAQNELVQADKQLEAAQKVIDELERAGPLLWQKTVDIQIAVSREVDKTVPDLAAVMRAAQGLRDLGYSMSGAEPLKPKDTTAQSKAADERTATAADLKAQSALEAAALALSRARAALDRQVRPWSGVNDRDTRALLNACSVKTTGVQLRVTPTGDDLPVAKGGKAVFYVSGGSGVPSAKVIAGPVAADVPVRVEGGQFRFEFVPPSTLNAGDRVVLQFSDGAGAATHVVQLQVTEAAAPAGDTSTSPAARTDPPAGSDSPLMALSKEDLADLGLGAGATLEQRREALARCRRDNPAAGSEAGDTIAGETKRAMQAGKCRAAG
jgi:hypothetical protein